MRNRIACVLLSTVALGMLAVPAQAIQHHQPSGTASAVPADWADGEVRRVDKDAQKLTIRHGPLPKLDMPTPMTMVYRVKDAGMLEQVKAGDKVKFQAEKVSGAFTITAIETAK
jgi:Cu(I)/Ag(I) efflux system periplasmic protein CusF